MPTRRQSLLLLSTIGAAALAACQRSIPMPRINVPSGLPGLGPASSLGPPPGSSEVLDRRFGVVEGFADTRTMADIGAGWERLVFFWPDIQPSGPADFSGLGRTLPRQILDSELRRGVRLTGLLEFTPAWAAVNAAHGQHAVPRNLELPVDDPNNYFARFVERIVGYYAGWIDEWIIWNEPDFRPTDRGAGDSVTWLGTDAEFAQLLKVAYLAAKQANPKAAVVFPATTYWVEAQSTPKRDLFYARILQILSGQADVESRGWYHDAVALNLYRSPDDIYRIHGVFTDIQQRHGVSSPVWLTETNAMPSTDRQVPCWQQHVDGWHTTLDEQAAFAVQAYALAAAAGYQRMGFYKMIDDHACDQVAEWGLVRDDGTRRPVATSLATLIHLVEGYTRARFEPLVRKSERWAAWPKDATSFTPNWQVYQVAFDKPGGQRVSVLWNGEGAPLRIRVARHGSSMRAYDVNGIRQSLDNASTITLAAATAYFHLSDTQRDPEGYHYIGGSPMFLVEDDVPADAPVAPPALA